MRRRTATRDAVSDLQRVQSDLNLRKTEISSSETSINLGSQRLPRSFSEPNLYQNHSIHLPHTKSTFSLVQRSGAPLMKKIISLLRQKAAPPDCPPPETECATLANCSSDPYYRVVIAASGGIQAVVQAMEAFRTHESVQASGCATIANICTNNCSNQMVAQQSGALQAVVDAIRLHPLSMVVLVSACDALMHLTSRNYSNIAILKETQDFKSLMEYTMQQSMPSVCHENAKILLRRMVDMDQSLVT